MRKVIIYSTDDCPYCLTLKEFLEERNIKFDEIDITNNKFEKEEMIKKSGQKGVPVVDIDGQIVVGFDREKICKLLGITEL